MKKFMKGALLMGAVMAGTASYAQIQDEENVTVTMELVPILQLNMNTPDQVNFVFDEISEYIGGITQYGATILTASSTVSWDLFASGTSGAHANGGFQWDQQVVYGAGNGLDSIPLRALELRQFPQNIADTSAGAQTVVDYSATFTPISNPVVQGNNNIYVSADNSPYTAPGAGLEDRYIAGGDGLSVFVAGGSYLTELNVNTAGGGNAYYYVIDYRIVPGLPAVFPMSTDGVGGLAPMADYANPGVYTMNVKYLMIENQ